jgi:hypothetical protein
MKTGTQSIIHKLKNYCDQFDGGHYKAKELKHCSFKGVSKIQADKNKSAYLAHKYWDDYFKFAFVRNPWDHFLSLYYWMKKNGTTKKNFTEFVNQEYNNNYDCLSDWGFTCLWDRISENDECIIDYVARFEDIDNEWKIITDKIGIPYSKLNKLNSSSREKNYRDYYTIETKNMVSELYKKDIEKFNYEF